MRVPCSNLDAARSTFSSSGFDPHGWLGGGSGGSGGGEGSCYCDAECTTYGDCCPSCPGTAAKSGGGGQGKCYCDAVCTKHGDCCADCSGGNPGGGGASWQSAKNSQQGGSGEWTKGECFSAGVVAGLTPAVLWAMCGLLI